MCPLWICVRRPSEPEGGPDESPTPRVHPEGPPLGHSSLGARLSALGTLAWPRDLGTSAAFSLCSGPLPADSPVSPRPGPAENSGDAVKVPGICSWFRGPGPLLPDGQGPSPAWPPWSAVTGCEAWPGLMLCTPGRAGPEVGFAPQAGRTLELPPGDPRSQPGACARAPLQACPSSGQSPRLHQRWPGGRHPWRLCGLAPLWQQVQCVWQSAVCGP